MQVDLSKFHDLRVEKALHGVGSLPDVAMLQTTFDFDDWSKRGLLLPFKPAGVTSQKPGYANADGTYLTAMMVAFQPTYATDRIPAGSIPTRYQDFLSPQYANGRLALTKPNDDDAVLYVYDRLRQTFGPDYLTALRDQNPRWLRGTAAPAALVGKPGETALGNLTGFSAPPHAPGIIPADDAPFLVWNQRAAVFNDAQHKTAGKLFLAYVASKEFQSTYQGWRTRTDLTAGADLPALEQLPGADPAAFIAWMADRAHVAQVRSEMEAIFGAVEGPSPLNDPALLNILGVDTTRATAAPEPLGPVR